MSLYNLFKQTIKSRKVRDFSKIHEELAKDEFIFENFESEISNKKELDGNIADFAFHTLAESPLRTAMVDYGMPTPKSIKAGMLLAISIAVSKYVKKNIQEARVAIALPPGILSFVTNLAVMFTEKVPVNLNFSLGSTPIISALEQADAKNIFSTQALLDKFPKFPRDREIIDILDVLKLTKKTQLIKLFAEICVLPCDTLAKKYKIPTEGGEKEAVLLFSSGTTGTPKGVQLSHKNLIANCLQLHGSGIQVNHKSLLGCLPIFHSFGMTVNMWFATLAKIKIVTISSPLDYKRIAEAIEKEEVHLFVNTPTFLRPYLTQTDSKKLSKLRCAVAGAERVPVELSSIWEKKFGSELLAGYGLTEATPVVALNFPVSYVGKFNQRQGSVGRVLPGIAVKFIGPETHKTLPLGETGILCLKGANIFSGYLNNEERTNEILQDEWLITGDLARLDQDGFLFIEGRLSRFSKIGGEMVPHIGIEEAISKILDINNSEKPKIAIVSRIDPKKGESIVLLSSIELNISHLNSEMLKLGYSNLWIPKEVVQVGEIPVLATGKLDLGCCKRLLAEKLMLDHK